MRAVQFDFSMSRYAYTKAAGALRPSEFYGPRSCVHLNDVPEPTIRGPHWLKLRSVLSGICGSDMGAVLLHDSPTIQAFASFPFTFGHENYSVVEEVGQAVKCVVPGDRVVVIPLLGCATRDIEPMCGPCSSGFVGACENFAEGSLAPGTNTGFCRDTGGGWSKYYLAHESQIVKVPDGMTDEQAVMIEPFCSALHPVMRGLPSDGDSVLVIGAGVIGLGVVAAIRALGVDCHIAVSEPVARNRSEALAKGADETIDPESEFLYERAGAITGARIYKPMLEKKICMGGFDRVFDCVGSTGTVNDAFRLAAGSSTVVLIGIQVLKRLDWTPVWLKGITLIGNMCYGLADYEGQRVHSFDIAIDLIGKGKVDMSDIITHRFALDDYREAIALNMDKGANNMIKSVFEL